VKDFPEIIAIVQEQDPHARLGARHVRVINVERD
jgi:hypothetical protein